MTTTTIKCRPIIITAAFATAVAFIASIGRKERERRLSLASAMPAERTSGKCGQRRSAIKDTTKLAG